jgi:hypothetical protein
MNTLGISLIATGTTLLFAGLVPALASFVFTRKRTVVDVAGSTSLTESSGATARPYRGIVVPLHYPFTELIFSFRETSGESLEAKVMDLVPEYGGRHVIMTYRNATGPSGELRVGLQPGTYDIHISSTDDDDRTVDYTVRGIETTYPLRRYLEVALAVGTIGAVALVQGLVLVIE